jgi:hypothetical protein
MCLGIGFLRDIYSITLYEKVKRAVIPIGRDGDFVLMVSFDNEADHDSIIRNKIMPLVCSYHQKYSKKSSCCRRSDHNLPGGNL